MLHAETCKLRCDCLRFLSSSRQKDNGGPTEGILSPYLRSKRLSPALPYIKGRVLDVGCGVGLLAVIEHVEDYIAFLRRLKGYLKDSDTARIVGTTPHPWTNWIYWSGIAHRYVQQGRR